MPEWLVSECGVLTISSVSVIIGLCKVIKTLYDSNIAMQRQQLEHASIIQPLAAELPRIRRALEAQYPIVNRGYHDDVQQE